MTDKEIIDLLVNLPEMLESELTEEQVKFICKPEEERTAHEKQLYQRAFAIRAKSLEHAADTIRCRQVEMYAAAKIVRAIREKWIAAGVDPKELDDKTTAGQLLSLLEREVEKVRRWEK